MQKPVSSASSDAWPAAVADGVGLMVSCDGAAVGCECPLTMTPAHTKPAKRVRPPATAAASRQRECARAFPAASVSLATSRNRRQLGVG